MKGKKVSLIGGAGFVGTNLAERLESRGVDFEIIDLKKSRRYSKKSKVGDIRNLSEIKSLINGDIVVNLAAVHRDDIKDKNDYYKTNVVGAINVIKSCEKKKINRIVFVSSVAVYGFAAPYTSEDGVINPFNDYGVTKYQAELEHMKWQKKGDNFLTIVRPTVIFGLGNRGNVYNLFNQIYKKRFVMIGLGKNKKSMAYVENVAAFLEECLENPAKHSVFNYVDGPDFTMKELVLDIKKVLFGDDRIGLTIPVFIGLFLGFLADALSIIIRKSLPVSLIRIKKFCANSTFSSNKKKLNNFKEPVNLKVALKRTLEREFINPCSKTEKFYTE